MKTLFQQLSTLWGQLGINQRVSLGVATLAVVGGMIALVLWSGRPQMQLLYGRLGEKELSEVAAVLQEQGVKYEMGNGSVYVPSEQVHKLRMALAQRLLANHITQQTHSFPLQPVQFFRQLQAARSDRTCKKFTELELCGSRFERRQGLRLRP